MRAQCCIALSLILLLLLCACTLLPKNPTVQTTSTAPETEAIDIPPSLPTEVALPEETEAAQPLHSELYLPDYTPEQIVEYFNEVVLNVEYTDGTGADDLTKKWLSPISYQIYGEPSDTDREVLEALFAQLNAIEGFPGIFPAADISQENVSISFLEPDVFRDSFSDVIHGEDAYGAVQYWYYTATNELHTARIGYRTDVDQATRNSVLVEEIINILGISDSFLRPDSITYQFSNENTALSDVDLVILKLLYSPDMQCGYDTDICSAIIHKLYY